MEPPLSFLPRSHTCPKRLAGSGLVAACGWSVPLFFLSLPVLVHQPLGLFQPKTKKQQLLMIPPLPPPKRIHHCASFLSLSFIFLLIQLALFLRLFGLMTTSI